MSESRALPDGPAFDRDLVASALHALADLIDNCEVDRQLLEFDPDELRQHAAVLEGHDRLAADAINPPAPGGGAPQRSRLQDALSTAMHHLAPRWSGELIYASPSGDNWTLLRDGRSPRMVVRHVPNQASGGRVSETELSAFLARQSDSPEYVALRRLLKDS